MGKLYAKPPPGQIDLMNSLITQVTIAGIPNPMPVIMKAVTSKRFQGSGPRPQIIMDTGGNRLGLGNADGVAPLKAEAARQVNLANDPFAKLLHSLQIAFRRAPLRPVHRNPVVLADRLDQLVTFPPSMRAGLLNIDV